VIGAIVLALPERLGEKVQRRRGTISLGHARGVDFAMPIGPGDETEIADQGDESQHVIAAYGRDLIMTKDPDAYTTLGKKR